MEIWKGQFACDEADYGVVPEVDFELQINLVLNEFTGFAKDAEFSELSSLPIRVEGFFDKDHVIFTTTYPCCYDTDENGKKFIDESIKGHEVVHDGYFDPLVDKWTGDWEIVIDEQKDSSGMREQIYVGGTWELDLPFDSFNNSNQ